MQSPQEKHQLPVELQVKLQAGSLCAAVRDMIENYLILHSRPEETHLENLSIELQTLHKYLHLIEKVRCAAAHRSELEQSHLKDIDRLLHRCLWTLSSLEHSLNKARDQDRSSGEVIKSADIPEVRYSVSSVYIGFYKRTLELSLMSMSL